MECSAFCIMGQCGFSLNRFYIFQIDIALAI